MTTIDASVLVVGGGAIGGITAAKLTGEVRRVVVLDADERHVARLREPGLIFDEAGAEHTVALDAVASPAELDGEFDFALVAVKSPFHRDALEPLAALPGIDAFVSLGNGLIQDRMAELVGADRLLSCIVEWGGTNLGPGRVVRDTIAPMVVGELDGSERPRTQLLARCLEAVGDVRLTRNVRGQIWSKLLVNTAFTGLSAVSGLRYGAVAEHPDGREAAYAIWAEGFAVAWAEGVTLDTVLDVEPRELVDRDDAALARMMAIAGNTKPSMLQDLEQGRLTEVDVVNGGVAQRARAHRIATPFNDRVVELVHAMERGERSPAPQELTELVRVAGAPSATVRERLIEDLQAEVDVLGGDRQRRGDAQHAAQPGELDDVHVQAELDAALGHRRAVARVGLAGLAVADQVDAEHEADAADVADDLVAALELLQAGAQARARSRRRGSPRSSAMTVRSTARPTAAGSGSETWEVTCRKPLSNASCSIASVVMVADSGRPPPSVLESATKSGTTSCCSKANIVPTRPSAVCASSTTSSIPRSSQRCLSAAR